MFLKINLNEKNYLDFFNMEENQKKSIKDYAPQGTKDCQSACDREVVQTKVGPVIVCHYCQRIVRVINK